MNSSLTLSWEYMTGYVVATDAASRERAEWPPHPARVFMAMAAAWFETAIVDDSSSKEFADYQAEADALRWLENLPEPELIVPETYDDAVRTAVTVYVPVNDKADVDAPKLQSAPAFPRKRQPRTFPRRYVGYEPSSMYWNSAPDAQRHISALSRLSEKVTRIGHSSSLVRMWAQIDAPPTNVAHTNRFKPTRFAASDHLRMFTPGLFDALPSMTGIPKINGYAESHWRVADAEAEAKEAKQSGDSKLKAAASARLKNLKNEFQVQTGEKWKETPKPPPRRRPIVSHWSAYELVRDQEIHSAIKCGAFDTDLLIFSRIEGPKLPVTSTLAVLKALRGAIFSKCLEQPIPQWVSGHEPTGTPSTDERGHMALLPMPFIGWPNADGSLLGVAVSFPRSVSRKERGAVLANLLFSSEVNEAKGFELRLGSLGVWKVCKTSWDEPRRVLNPETWTAAPNGVRQWASVTPVVLDRFPKADRSDPKVRAEWNEEVQEIISSACRHAGLPTPMRLDVGVNCWHPGGPRAYSKTRRLRSDSQIGGFSAALGGDYFPAYPAKTGAASRPQVHVQIEFAEPVIGPVLLGAGRHMGYGLLKPWGNA